MRMLDATHGAWLGRLCSLGAIGASLHKPLFVFALMSAARGAPRPRRTLTHLSAAHMLQTVALSSTSTFQGAQPFLISQLRAPTVQLRTVPLLLR